MLVMFIPRALRLQQSTTAPISRLVTATLLVGSVVVLVIEGLNASGVVFQRSFSGYVVGVLWLLVALGIVFSRLLFLATKPPS